MNSFSSVLKFKQKKLLGIIVYLLVLQVILSSLTEKDLRIISDFLYSYTPVLLTEIHSNIFAPYFIEPGLSFIEQVPGMIIVFSALIALVAVMFVLMFIGGYILSLVLKLLRK